MKNLKIFFRIACVVWIFWGLVHVLAGVLTMGFVLSGDISAAVAGIADAVDPDVLQLDYHDEVGAIIGQHGFNLFWIGFVTVICAFFIWKGNKNAIFLAAIAGGLADMGYFILWT
jgi:hypothetical protein